MKVFPTCVGVNRSQMAQKMMVSRIPYMRRGEPQSADEHTQLGEVFPTCVGVNRSRRISGLLFYSIPYMRRGYYKIKAH